MSNIHASSDFTRFSRVRKTRENDVTCDFSNKSLVTTKIVTFKEFVKCFHEIFTCDSVSKVSLLRKSLHLRNSNQNYANLDWNDDNRRSWAVSGDWQEGVIELKSDGISGNREKLVITVIRIAMPMIDNHVQDSWLEFIERDCCVLTRLSWLRKTRENDATTS